jgi:hypothetical protein
MPRPQFSIRNLLWLTLVVAVLARNVWPAVDWVRQMTEIDFSSGAPELTAEDWGDPRTDKVPRSGTQL